MNREIKFRAWDNFNDCMWKPTDNLAVYFTNMQELIVAGNGITYMQFVGLKDINGVDIYEGDILKTETGKNMVVGWSKEHASFVVERDGWAFKHYFHEAFEASECEVIGNIYENPELLK